MERKRFDKEDFKLFVLNCLKEAELNSELEGCENLSVTMSFFSYGPVPHENKINFLDVFLGANGKDEVYAHYPSGESVDIINLNLRNPKMYKVDISEGIVNIGDIRVSIPYHNVGYESKLL